MYQKIILRYKNPAKRRFGGFTLIELLVVVLIIGILAAIAVPQYKKAVFKARASEALVLFNAVVKAADVYMMSNGQFPQNIEDLDIEIPVPNIVRNGETSAFCEAGTLESGQEYAYCYVGFLENNQDFIRLVYRNNREKVCFARGHSATSSSELAVHFCQSVGELKRTSLDWDEYLMY